MKNLICTILILLGFHFSNAQVIRVAILDFENISGIAKYDGLGKAMSSMLISDIESNVSPKRLQLVERAQIQKILKEQNFQASSNVNKATAVQAGKILGVKYLLLGDVYVLNEQLIINARLANTETGDIIFSKKQEGKMGNWLILKTNIAKDLATNLAMPFTEPRIKDDTIQAAVLTTYGNAIIEKDKGNLEKAEVLINATKEFYNNFTYLDDLNNEVQQLKRQIENLEDQVETAVENPIAAAVNFKQKNDFKTSSKYLQIGLRRLTNIQFGKKYIYFRLLSENYYNDGDYVNSIAYADSILRIYKYDDNAIYFKALSLVKQNKNQQAILLFKNQLNNYEFAWTKKEFIEQVKSFEENTNNKFYGAHVIQLFDKPFQISIDGQPQFEGEIFEQGNFTEQLKRYEIIFKNLNKTPLQFAEEIDLLLLKGIPSNLPSYTITKPFYLPASRYISLKTESNQLIIVETGQSYSGNYFTTHDGKTYTGISPQSCPCKLLFTRAEYDKHIQSSKSNNYLVIEDRLERERLFAVGWYFLLAKNPEKSISRYTKLLEYYNNLISDYMEYQKLSSSEKDLIRMAEINIGHSFLLKNDFINAKVHYLKSSLNNEFNGSRGTTAKDIIVSDWNDLIRKGVFTSKLINEFTFKSSDIF